jgi:hypothetical protein
MVKMTTTVSVFTHKLEAYRTRIQASFRLEVNLRSHIAALVSRCGEMTATVSSLDKVRDAIRVLGVCPGLGRLTFVIPKFTGQLLAEDFNSMASTDPEIDEAMNALCASNAPNEEPPSPAIKYIYRAAESSELLLRSIEDMPSSNTASVPLMGTCPNCEGTPDVPDGVQHASLHSRICWDPDAEINGVTKRRDCSTGRKAVMCVQDRDYGDVGR